MGKSCIVQNRFVSIHEYAYEKKSIDTKHVCTEKNFHKAHYIYLGGSGHCPEFIYCRGKHREINILGLRILWGTDSNVYSIYWWNLGYTNLHVCSVWS